MKVWSRGSLLKKVLRPLIYIKEEPRERERKSDMETVGTNAA